MQEAQYQQLGLAAALRRPADFATATSELAAIVRHLYAGHCSKAVQALVVEDVALAIACCDGYACWRCWFACEMPCLPPCLLLGRREALGSAVNLLLPAACRLLPAAEVWYGCCLLQRCGMAALFGCFCRAPSRPPPLPSQTLLPQAHAEPLCLGSANGGCRAGIATVETQRAAPTVPPE